MRHFLIVLMLVVVVSSCKEDPDPVLSTAKSPYIGNQLKTTGYYSLSFNNAEARYLNYFLYRDGTILYGGSPLQTEVISRESEYANGQWAGVSANEKTFWGVFTVSGNSIFFDQWYLRDGNVLASYKTYGTILNDTTFVMTSTDREGFEDVPLDETYRFTAFSAKPDSVNQFLD